MADKKIKLYRNKRDKVHKVPAGSGIANMKERRRTPMSVRRPKQDPQRPKR